MPGGFGWIRGVVAARIGRTLASSIRIAEVVMAFNGYAASAIKITRRNMQAVIFTTALFIALSIHGLMIVG
jgi:hypothetical protein